MLEGYRIATTKEWKLPRIRYDFELPEIYSLHLLYTFLKKHFGKSGSLTWDRRIQKGVYGDDRDKFQWDYLIRTPHGFIRFYDRDRYYIYWYAYTIAKSKEEAEQLNVYRGKVDPPQDLQQDIDEFFNEYSKYEKSVVSRGQYELDGNAHPGIIILNPFEIHFSNFKYHSALANKRIRKLDRRDYLEWKYAHFELEKLFASSFILLMASFDGFINILYECFLLGHMRQNDKLRDKISREKMDFKIDMLPFYCHGFLPSDRLSKQLKHSFKDRMDDYNELATLRNKLVHANLFGFRYTNMVEEDTFLFYNDFVKKDHLFGVSTEDTIERWTSLLNKGEKTILSLIRLIIRTMEVNQRKQFRRIYRDYWIGYVSLGKNRIRFVREEIR